MTASRLELRVPPVAVVLVAAVLMWMVAAAMPPTAFPLVLRVTAGIGLAVLGLAITLAGVLAFRTARTTVNPTTPEASSTIVHSGIYRVTRNPMYLGFLLMLAGWAAWLGNPWSVIVLAGFVAYLNRFQIAPEERVLQSKFGAPYDAYRQRVRRWL